MPRQARLDSPGTLHHVIVRGIEKRRIVDNVKDQEDFVFRLGGIAKETKTAIYAWALMTNHAHILLRSGTDGISKFMRRFLTGYAITYNLRHNRHGHLFQNRYKSIICDENTYFTELVRYIHLNPLRSGMVATISELDRYRYCGHSVIVGKTQYDWQDSDYTLKWFGNKEKEAIKTYREFVIAGIEEGRRPDLVGGGLTRSVGRWSEVVSIRRRGQRQLSDERILGSGEFVQKILEEAEERTRNYYTADEKKAKIREVVKETCRKNNIKIDELYYGGRRRNVSFARAQAAHILIEDFGIALAEVARNLGVTTSAIFNMLKRKNDKFN